MDFCPRDCVAASDGGSRYFASTGTIIVYSSLSDCYLYFTQIFGKELIWRRLDDDFDNEDGERESLLSGS